MAGPIEEGRTSVHAFVFMTAPRLVEAVDAFGEAIKEEGLHSVTMREAEKALRRHTAIAGVHVVDLGVLVQRYNIIDMQPIFMGKRKVHVFDQEGMEALGAIAINVASWVPAGQRLDYKRLTEIVRFTRAQLRNDPRALRIQDPHKKERQRAGQSEGKQEDKEEPLGLEKLTRQYTREVMEEMGRSLQGRDEPLDPVVHGINPRVAEAVRKAFVRNYRLFLSTAAERGGIDPQRRVLLDDLFERMERFDSKAERMTVLDFRRQLGVLTGIQLLNPRYPNLYALMRGRME